MIHPHILQLIEIIKKAGHTNVDDGMIKELISIGATSTQATFVIHQGFNIELLAAEKIILEYISLFKPTDIADVAYETFLYDNYDPNDPNFEETEDMVRFSLKRKDN